MILVARILSLLLLAGTLFAQDAPQPPEPPPNNEAVLENDVTVEPTEEVETADTKTTRRDRNRRRHTTHGTPPVFGQNIIIRTNEVRDELVLIGGSVDVQGEVRRAIVAVGGNVKVSGRVGGEIVVVGGKVDISGEVDGDTVIAMGRADIASTAKMQRDLVMVGGPFNVSPDAEIGGENVLVPFGDVLPHIEWAKRYLVRGPLMGRWLTFEIGWPWVIAGTFLAVYLGLLLAFPAAARAVFNALEERPVTSIFAGLLTLILFAPLVFLLIISVAGILVVPFLKIALLLALLFGKVGVLCFLGRGLARTSGAAKLQVPFLAFVIGAIILTLSYAIPFFGIFAWAMATVFGLGGAIVALSGSFKREEGKVPLAPVYVSTLRPTGGATAGSTGTAPAASQPIPGATVNPSGGATAALPGFGPSISEMNPRDALLLARAGFWKRFLAALLDQILLIVAVIVLPVIGPVLYLPMAVLYFAGMWAWRGTTVGSLVLGLKVVRTDGSPMTFAVALVRSVLSIFSLLVVGLGFIWAAWDREKQSWHDKIAGTVVVKMPAGFALI
ncbi:MAG TPA: RDD family protein [Verrucomicrobiae bacterium]